MNAFISRNLLFASALAATARAQADECVAAHADTQVRRMRMAIASAAPAQALLLRNGKDERPSAALPISGRGGALRWSARF